MEKTVILGTNDAIALSWDYLRRFDMNKRCIASRLSFVATLILAGILLLVPASSTPVSANLELPTRCNQGLVMPPSAPPAPPVPEVRVVPPGEPPIDGNWPIVAQWTITATDASDRKHRITHTIREDPKLSTTASPLSACTYEASRTWTVTATIGGLTQ